jgi:hypothetical protein
MGLNTDQKKATRKGAWRDVRVYCTYKVYGTGKEKKSDVRIRECLSEGSRMNKRSDKEFKISVEA